MDEKITYEEMIEQLDQKGIRITNGERRLYVALNNGVKAEVLGNCGPATISLMVRKVNVTFTCVSNLNFVC
ncbi:hypothetical protein ABLA30_00560 [Xenorhabdus nematophila]|uniref:hypothetical protein n=1 Tax=Xenorhabdus nematophila TaxID=628 RepID=UPI0032B74E75